MSRTSRALLCALCLLAFGLAVAPAPVAAQAPPPGPAPLASFTAPFPLFHTVRVVGAGETAADALDNALELLREDYIVLRYTVLNSFCAEIEVPGSEDPFGNPDMVTLCSAEVEARVLRRAILFP